MLPGKRLSYQMHARRSEHWFIVRGRGRRDPRRRAGRCRSGDGGRHSRSGSSHRIENTGSVDLVFVEVQHGDYFGEDDIVRLDDDFGRAGTTT